MTLAKYTVWLAAQEALGRKPNMKAVMVVHSYGVRVCTISVAGIKLCSDGDYKTQVKYGKGLRVCMIAPDPKCGE